MRFVWRWVAPAVLLAGALVAAGTGLVVGNAHADAEPLADQGRVTTPLLSARRLPRVVAEPVARQRLQRDLLDWVSVSPADSCLTVSSPEGEALFEYRAGDALRPASAQKLLTATAALVELGPDHRYRTLAAAAGPPADGVLGGDLFLVGGGDPVLASPDYAARFRRQPQLYTDLDQLAASIVDAGVRRIEGTVVGDERRYDQARYVAGWPDRYIAQNQIGPMSALAVNDGFAAYPAEPGDASEVQPAGDPAANAAEVLARLLRDRGVEVGGPARAGSAPEGAVELASVESAPLTEIAAQLLRESDNNTGELIVKELGLARSGAGTTDAGTMAMAAILADAGVGLDGVAISDGSGLSLDNRVTCELLMELLLRDGTGPLIVDGLAVAGESGTLRDRFVGELAGRLRAKTGALNTVTALAGVLDDDDGRLVFSYVANVPDGAVIGAATIALQDGLAQTLLGYPRTPDVSVLGPQPPVVPDPPVEEAPND